MTSAVRYPPGRRLGARSAQRTIYVAEPTRKLLIEVTVNKETGGFTACIIGVPPSLVHVNADVAKYEKLMLTPGTALRQLGDMLDEALVADGWTNSVEVRS
jgi:hypothetical protein